MPLPLGTHVLTVDANVIHKVDTANPANLYSMWTVFSRCADSVEQGRRLENLSWRLWQKEQLVENQAKLPVDLTNTNITTPPTTTTTATDINQQTSALPIPSDIRFLDVPQLSGSVESLADDETVEFTSVSAPLEIARPRILRQDSSTSSRSRRDRHTSSDDFEKMIVSIVKDKAPLSAPLHNKPTMAPQQQKPNEPSADETQSLYRSGSTTTESQSPSKNSDLHSEDSHPSPEIQPRPTTVVRGFSPSQQSLTKKSLLPTPQLAPVTEPAIPEPTSAPAPKIVRSGKPKAAFALGASYSSSEQGQSVDAREPVAPKFVKNPAKFKLGGSSEEEGSLKSALHSSRSGNGLTAQKKQASFSNHVITHSMDDADDNAIDSDSEADYIDESAIDDDDDSSDWEDSIEDSGKSSVDEKYFQRVDSKANLTSRRSLITLMFAQSEDRQRKLGNQGSQSTSALAHGQPGRQAPTLGVSPNDSDDAPLMMKGARQQPALKPIKEIPRSGAQPIATTSHTHGQAAMSPRTTRRNMLATELTESLRRHLLWERSQKSSTANAVLKRRHTSHDVANLKQYPEKVCMKKSEDVNSGSFNQFFSKESFEGYNAKGW